MTQSLLLKCADTGEDPHALSQVAAGRISLNAQCMTLQGVFPDSPCGQILRVILLSLTTKSKTKGNAILHVHGCHFNEGSGSCPLALAGDEASLDKSSFLSLKRNPGIHKETQVLGEQATLFTPVEKTSY